MAEFLADGEQPGAVVRARDDPIAAELAAQDLDLGFQEATEDAILAAMSGSFKQADAAIREARALGDGTGWTHMLQRMLSLQKGNWAGALQKFEQAARLLPTSVSARALLLSTYYFSFSRVATTRR